MILLTSEFRCGQYGWQVPLGQQAEIHVPHPARLCRCCQAKYVKDEHHLLFDRLLGLAPDVTGS